MLVVLAISLAQSGASSPASVLQPSGIADSKVPGAADLFAKESAAGDSKSSASKSAAHLARDARDAESASSPAHADAKAAAHAAMDAAKAEAHDRRAAEKAASEARRADAKKEHESRAADAKTEHDAKKEPHATTGTAPSKIDKNLDIPKATSTKVMGGGGHEPKAVSVVTAIMLLSSLTFGTIVFYLVNYPRAAIVNHTWSAISVTICIFCAVLLFNASNGLTTWLLAAYDDGVNEPPMEHEEGYGKESYPAAGYGHQEQQGHQEQGQQGHQEDDHPHVQWRSVMWAMGGGGDDKPAAAKIPDGYIFTLAFIQFLVWYCIFGVSMVFFSGVKRWPWEDKTKEASHDTKHINAKAGCMLLAHVAGFAAINCFGILMRMDPFSASWPMTFLAVLIACAIVFMMVTAYRALRNKFATGGSEADRHLLEEEAEEGGEDIMALLASFLLVQVFRYALTGILPDGHGGEPADMIGTHMGSDHHELYQVLALLGYGYMAAMLCAGVVFFNAMPTPFSAYLSGAKVQQVVRMVTMTMAMVHCWCLYFAGMWVMAASDIAEFLGVYEDSALLKVLLACVLTLYAFVLIFLLEYLASLDATGPKADQAIYTVMGSLGILVGFTWEQAFERSVSTVVQASDHLVEPPLLKAILALTLVAMVCPAWRMYIILHTMKHSTEHMAEATYEHGKKLPMPDKKPDHQEQAVLEKHGPAP